MLRRVFLRDFLWRLILRKAVRLLLVYLDILLLVYIGLGRKISKPKLVYETRRGSVGKEIRDS